MNLFPSPNEANLKSAILESYNPYGASFDIPIKVWIYRDGEGENEAISKANVNTLITRINELHSNSNTDIAFYLKCDPDFVDNYDYNNNAASDADFIDMWSDNRDYRAVNLHIVHSSDITGLLGISVYPNYPPEIDLSATIIEDVHSSLDELAATAVHEMGHVFGLMHPHDCARCENQILCAPQCNQNFYASKCEQESVNRSRTNNLLCISTYGEKKCEINGDLLCSTEASYNSLRWETNQTTCAYTNSFYIDDHWDDLFDPQENNFMAYNHAQCQNAFTDEQIAVMKWNIAWNMIDYLEDNKMEFFYESNLLYASGDANNGQNEDFTVSEFLISPTPNKTFNALNGSEITFHAGKSVKMRAGFKVSQGAHFKVSAGPITNCNSVDYLIEEQSYSKSTDNELTLGALTQGSLIQKTSDLKFLQENALKHLEEKKALHADLELLYALDSTLIIDLLNEDSPSLENLVSNVKSKYLIFEKDYYLFPNPVTNVLNLNIMIPLEIDIQFRIYNSVGEEVLTKSIKKGTPSMQFNISQLKPGVYNCFLITPTSSISRSIIKL